MNRFLSREQSIKLLREIKKSGIPYFYDNEKHRLIILDDLNNELAHLRLPITIKSPDELLTPINYVLLLIQSGSCSLGYYEDSINLHHKVISAYMVRKKQGTSQIKYLKTKGKSRAGSRVRLGETAEFFDNINTLLQNYFDNHDIHRIALSCSKILIPYLFNTKTPCPFNKKDQRIMKIPKHVDKPTFEVMSHIHKFLLKGELVYEEENTRLIQELAGI
ncbi:MAG: hypothetical protein ACK4ND_11600 [Cytophagaceae bacterium]